MCGVFGYVGERADVGSTVLSALKLLEYRGYDSWGVAVGAGSGLLVRREIGKINGATLAMPPSTFGLGHTRWATHGGVTEANAHPHLDCGGDLAVVHNGIVENQRELREALEDRGHAFRSETDSEVIAHLIEERLRAGDDLAHATAAAFGSLKGFNAVVAVDARSGEMAAAKLVSPLVAAVGRSGTLIASDALALHGHADRVVYLEDDDLIRLTRDGLVLYQRSTMTEKPLRSSPLPASTGSVELGRHRHFMIKEITEQPAVLERLAQDSEVAVAGLADAIARADRTFLVGCGTASYAALSGAYLFARIAAQPVILAVGSEFSHVAPFVTPNSLVVGLSQSGETVDLIEAMMAARGAGARLAAIVNVEQSTLDRMVDLRVHLGAGPEQCVLATKSYTAKVATMLLVGHALTGSSAQGSEVLLRAADGIRTLLEQPSLERVKQVAESIQHASHLFVIGRGLSYPTALEAALKIKEVSYVHAEGFAGGELKHGVIALVEPGTPCLVYAPNDETRADIVSGAAELRSRGGYIIGVGPQPDPVFDVHLPTPDVGAAAPLVDALPAQLLGYHLALLRGNDPDKPRNLAKSVTVK